MLIVVEKAGIAVNTKCIAIMYPNLTINLIVTIMYGGYAYIVYCSRSLGAAMSLYARFYINIHINLIIVLFSVVGS